MADTVSRLEHEQLIQALRARNFVRNTQAQEWLTAKAIELGHLNSYGIEVDETPAIMDEIAVATPPP